MHAIFSEFALLLLISAAAGALAMRLNQPVLIAYIVVGIVAGPAALGLVSAQDQIDLLAQVGVSVLLFLVGLKLDVAHVRHIGPVALATGLGQLGFTISIGFVLVSLMGKTMMEALYAAVALTFSSTIIIVKLLSDKREIDALHGRIAVGFLIVQDLAVVIAMMAMSALSGGTGASALEVAASLAWRLVVITAVIYFLMRFVLPRVVRLMARSQELLLIFAIAWGTSLAALGEWAGFSREAGAFLAGFSLASTIYRDAISARLTGIRDFLLLFFFIDLGTKLDFSTLGAEVWPAAVLSLFVLIGNPLIVMAIMGYMGYRKRTGFLAGLTVAQISEFSIIFVSMGISLGHVGNTVLGLITLVGLVTIALSTYMILYSHRLYEWLAPALGLFERRHPHRELEPAMIQNGGTSADVLVFGLGRYGCRLTHGLKDAGLDIVAVDFDPEVVRTQRRLGLDVRFGDGMEADFLAGLPLTNTGWAVSTFPDMHSNLGLVQALREQAYRGRVAVVARSEAEGATFRKPGVDTILYPVSDAVDYAITTLSKRIKEDR